VCGDDDEVGMVMMNEGRCESERAGRTQVKASKSKKEKPKQANKTEKEIIGR